MLLSLVYFHLHFEWSRDHLVQSTSSHWGGSALIRKYIFTERSYCKLGKFFYFKCIFHMHNTWCVHQVLCQNPIWLFTQLVTNLYSVYNQLVDSRYNKSALLGMNFFVSMGNCWSDSNIFALISSQYIVCSVSFLQCYMVSIRSKMISMI